MTKQKLNLILLIIIFGLLLILSGCKNVSKIGRKGHNEMSGHQDRNCPGVDMNLVRNNIMARFGNASWLFEELE